MKNKYLSISLLLFVLYITYLPASASAIRIDTLSMPIKTSNRLLQPINIAISADGTWKLFVEALNNQIINQDHPNYFIPLSRVELSELNGSPIAQFNTGKVIEVFAPSPTAINNMNLSLNLLSSDCDRAGDYSLDIKFTLVDGNSNTSDYVYTFRFNNEEISSIDFTEKAVNLSLDRNKILAKNASQNLNTPLGIYVSSNKDWKLFVRKASSNDEANIKTFVKTLGGDSSISCNTTNEYISINGNPILLASGKATINNYSNLLDKKLINIDYMVRGPKDKFIPAGSYNEELEYLLQTED